MWKRWNFQVDILDMQYKLELCFHAGLVKHSSAYCSMHCLVTQTNEMDSGRPTIHINGLSESHFLAFLAANSVIKSL